MRPLALGSDNQAGTHPTVLKAIIDANQGYEPAYGDDSYTEKLQEVFDGLFGQKIQLGLVFNGTGANTLGLASVVRSYEAVICTEVSHLNFDECGAPERWVGKLLSVPATQCPDGRLSVDVVRRYLNLKNEEHHVQPKVISITQTTELGTVYRPEEIRQLADFAHSHQMWLHMDGARISNAAAALGLSFKELVTDTGVDILSFGGTKAGLMMGEAVVFLNRELGQEFRFFRKQGMQLASKMRFVAAQFQALLENDLWKETACHANAQAKVLESKVREVKGIEIVHPVEANAVFAQIPRQILPDLQRKYSFFVWDAGLPEDLNCLVRWMTSFSTQDDDIDQFIFDLKKALKE